MSTQGQVGDLRNTDEGSGWTGVSNEDKRTAAAQPPVGSSPGARVIAAVSNAQHVAYLHGSGYWSGLRSMR